jgi:hypothetical protein
MLSDYSASMFLAVILGGWTITEYADIGNLVVGLVLHREWTVDSSGGLLCALPVLPSSRKERTMTRVLGMV